MCGLVIFLIILFLGLSIPASWMMGIARGRAIALAQCKKMNADPGQTSSPAQSTAY